MKDFNFQLPLEWEWWWWVCKCSKWRHWHHPLPPPPHLLLLLLLLVGSKLSHSGSANTAATILGLTLLYSTGTRIKELHFYSLPRKIGNCKLRHLLLQLPNKTRMMMKRKMKKKMTKMNPTPTLKTSNTSAKSKGYVAFVPSLMGFFAFHSFTHLVVDRCWSFSAKTETWFSVR